jgi:preprotein translocase subunit SecY
MILNHIRWVFSTPWLKNKILAVLWLILVYKFLAVIPVPWVDTTALKNMLDGQAWLSFFGALMWGWLENFSIILMGLSPYINAMIIIQLLGVIVPKIEQLQKEWEQGQKKITQYTRYFTLPLAILQSYGMIILLNSLAGGSIIDTTNTATILTAMMLITTGTMFLMWLGEIMTEKGIGNGISIIITAWVLAWVPSVINQYLQTSQYALFAALLVATLFVIYVIIKFTEWNRRIPVIYSKTGRDEKSYLLFL